MNREQQEYKKRAVLLSEPHHDRNTCSLLPSNMHSELIDTAAALIAFLDSLGECTGQPPSLYVDLEGNNLSRSGTLSLITILVEPQQKVYFVDVTTLNKEAFDTTGSKKRSIRSILGVEGDSQGLF